MAYNNNIPQPTDQLSTSQGDLLNNFSAIYTLVGVDHVNFNASGQGKHAKVTFPVQSPAPTFAAGDCGLYNFNYSVSGNNELFIVNQAGTATPITPVGASTSGWTYLPSSILLKWGSATITGTSQTVTFPVGATIPVFNNCFQVLLTSASNPMIFIINSVAALSFVASVYNSTTGASSTGTLKYLAIGN